ncbi:MAG: serine/threonine protein kinase [Actinobacteria bacterium]|nr:MAG: serine/threonine protein kinase [Actinomycetota bacterium]
MPVNVGDEFGPYTIESVLGQGGMGTVFLARHARLERRVALKVISPAFADEPDFRARFLRESQLAASLDHPHVIPIYDADEVDGVLYLAMRYVDGPSLQGLIRKRDPLSRGNTLRIAEQIGGALDAAHAADLIHRDLKPANILLTEADRHAYLCDFGLAKRTSTRGVTHAGAFLGTIDYCSPEQIRGEPLDGPCSRRISTTHRPSLRLTSTVSSRGRWRSIGTSATRRPARSRATCAPRSQGAPPRRLQRLRSAQLASMRPASCRAGRSGAGDGSPQALPSLRS